MRKLKIFWKYFMLLGTAMNGIVFVSICLMDMPMKDLYSFGWSCACVLICGGAYLEALIKRCEKYEIFKM